jgi:hypothetical protein
MRIYTPYTDMVHEKVTLFLTEAELRNLSATALGLIDGLGHNHVYDEAYQKEIILATLDPASVEHYDERSRRVIRDDK